MSELEEAVAKRLGSPEMQQAERHRRNRESPLHEGVKELAAAEAAALKAARLPGSVTCPSCGSAIDIQLGGSNR